MAAPQAIVIRIAGMDWRIPPASREALLVRAATLAAGVIKRRAREGQDFEGRALAPYSPRYAALRSAAGRGTKVDLTLSGQMLASLSVLRRSPQEAVLGFRGSAPAARIASRSKPVRGRRGATVTKAARTGPGTVENAAKAEWAHFGTERAPARPFFGLSERDYRLIVADVAQALRLEK